MTNTYRKLDDGSWGVLIRDWRHDMHGRYEGPLPGSTVVVTLKNGTSKTEKLGVRVDLDRDSNPIYSIAPKPTAIRERSEIGNLSGIMALFDKAKQHLKYPAIVLSCLSAEDRARFKALLKLRGSHSSIEAELAELRQKALASAVRLNVAGDQAKVPGSLNVTRLERPVDGGRAEWFGRIHQNGTFERTAAASEVLVERLMAFAANPAEVASEHGTLTGRCCFCHQALSDERSTAVGYGSTCAEHFGLPWGARPASFAEAVS